MPSLIDAVTGAPDGPFPASGSEAVSSTAGVQKPCSKMASSLGILPETRVFVAADSKNLAHFFLKVNPPAGKNLCQMVEKCVEIRPWSCHNTQVTAFYKRLHNPTAYVNICNFLTQDIAEYDDARPISCI